MPPILKQLMLLCLIAVQPLLPAERHPAWLTSNGLEIHHHLFSLFVMPNQSIAVQARKQGGQDRFELSGLLPARQAASGEWILQAPSIPGIYPCTVYRYPDADSIRLQVFVLTPYHNTEELEGYQIGRYPSGVMHTLTSHKPPSGFIKVTAENENTLVSPHFRLKQFLCKQEGDYPKFIILQEKLLQKLEFVFENLAGNGIVCTTLTVMSGFRTPQYNRALGNSAYSRHCWGGAADIFVDHDNDGMMDDLNQDGRCDEGDAKQLYDWIDAWSHEPVFATLLGGLARYRRTHSHGPFVHVDVRGHAVSWGD